MPFGQRKPPERLLEGEIEGQLEVGVDVPQNAAGGEFDERMPDGDPGVVGGAEAETNQTVNSHGILRRNGQRMLDPVPGRGLVGKMADSHAAANGTLNTIKQGFLVQCIAGNGQNAGFQLDGTLEGIGLVFGILPMAGEIEVFHRQEQGISATGKPGFGLGLGSPVTPAKRESGTFGSCQRVPFVTGRGSIAKMIGFWKDSERWKRKG